MNTINLLLAMLLTFSLSFAVLPENGFAKSSAGEVTVSSGTESGSKDAMKNVTEVNINTADEQVLTQVAGIGPVTAKRIVDYREENGNFQSIDELIKVKGIGEKTLAKMKPYLQKI